MYTFIYTSQGILSTETKSNRCMLTSDYATYSPVWVWATLNGLVSLWIYLYLKQTKMCILERSHGLVANKCRKLRVRFPVWPETGNSLCPTCSDGYLVERLMIANVTGSSCFRLQDQYVFLHHVHYKHTTSFFNSFIF